MDEKLVTTTESNASAKKCECCNINAANEDHTCPFKDEIYEDETQCNCCDSCTHECRQSI